MRRGKSLNDLWTSIQHEEVSEDENPQPLKSAEEIVVEQNQGPIAEPYNPKMNRWTHEFLDGEAEAQYQEVFSGETLAGQKFIGLLLLCVITGVLIHTYAVGGTEKEILATHAVHLLILAYVCLARFNANVTKSGVLLLVTEIACFLLSSFQTYHFVKRQESSCWEDGRVKDVTHEKEAYECISKLHIGFGSCAVYVGMIVVASVSLGRFKHFVVAAVVANCSSLFVFLQLLSFPPTTVLVVCLFFSLVFGQLNRAIDTFLRRDYLWFVDTKNHLVAHLDQVDAAKKHREQIVAYLFHEVRNPINNITLAIQAMSSLQDELEPNVPPTDSFLEELQQLTDVVIDASQSATHVLNDALDLEKLAAGSFTFVSVSFQLEELCGNVMRTVKARFDAKRIQVNVELDPEIIGFNVTGDLHRLQQVLQNFLSNAVKFTPEGGEVLVEIKSLEDASPILPRPCQSKVCLPARVAVSDTGPGLTQDEQKLLFKPFSQIRAGEMQGGGGTGLGLSLSKDFIQRGHRGRIGVTSPGSLGCGSTFYFDINYPVTNPRAQSQSTSNTGGATGGFARRLQNLTPRRRDSRSTPPVDHDSRLSALRQIGDSFRSIRSKRSNEANDSPAVEKGSLGDSAPPAMGDARRMSGSSSGVGRVSYGRAPFVAGAGGGGGGGSAQVTRKDAATRSGLAQSSLFHEVDVGTPTAERRDNNTLSDCDNTPAESLVSPGTGKKTPSDETVVATSDRTRDVLALPQHRMRHTDDGPLLSPNSPEDVPCEPIDVDRPLSLTEGEQLRLLGTPPTKPLRMDLGPRQRQEEVQQQQVSLRGADSSGRDHETLDEQELQGALSEEREQKEREQKEREQKEREQKEREEKEREQKEREQKEREQKEKEREAASSKKRVLVVEDSHVTRKLMIRALVKLGVEVETAENGQIACQIVDTAPEGRLSLLFMDQEMPVLDGVGATKAIRAKGHKIPIIAVTGNGHQQQREDFLRAGATEILVKPISPTKLVDVLKRHNMLP